MPSSNITDVIRKFNQEKLIYVDVTRKSAISRSKDEWRGKELKS